MDSLLHTALVMYVLAGSALGQVTGDFDGDGVVGFGDFVLFASAFGSEQTAFDLDQSGRVDFGDFVVFANAFASGPRPPHWRSLTSANSPPGRLDHTMVLDKKRNRLVVFAGKRESVLDDLWVLSLDDLTWSSVSSPLRPPGRRGHTAVVDTVRDQMIIFGGETDVGFLNDVWALDLETETWTEIVPFGSRPVPRYGLGAVLDGDRMILSHGFSAEGRFDDTWALDLRTQAWFRLENAGEALPQKRCLHGMALDAAERQMYLYGGCSSGVGPCPRGDLWTYDTEQQKWSVFPASENQPTDRSNVRIVFDEGERRLILFAGVDVRGTQDTWTYEPESSSWSQLEPTGDLPPVRWSQAMVFDDGRNRLLVFGGTDGAVWYDDLWELQF